MFARKNGDMAGLILPNMFPGEGHVREYRLRRDNPDIVQRIDGTRKEEGRYLGPPNRPNLAYFPVGVPLALLSDTNVPALITEGEFKSISAWQLALLNGSPRFLPIGIPGVHCFRGVIGKTTGPDGDRRDVKGIIPDFMRVAWGGRRVIIAFDADASSNPKVQAAKAQLAGVLIDLGAIVAFYEWPIEEGKGLDDHIALVGPARVWSELSGLEFGDWRTRLLTNEDGRILPCHDNVALFLEHSPEWKNALAFNEFTGAYTLAAPAPHPVTAQVGAELEDHFDTEVVRWLERKRLMVKPDLVRRVIDVVGRRNLFHPVRAYLNGLAWDGTKRIDSFFVEYCGSPDTAYVRAVAEKFFVGCVARIMEPGCKLDTVLIPEGPQGIGKSKLVRTLAGDGWSTDQLSDLGSKDASMQIRGVWLVEISELDALNRVDMARAKAFFSQQFERIRMPYGRRIVTIPRQCVFIGTTNSDTWLRDESGGRRFLPVRFRQVDNDAVARDRDQIWAEAVHLYRSGVRWWLEDKEVIADAQEEQRGRYVEDVWHEPVLEHAEYLRETKHSASIPEILSRMGIEVAKQDPASALRVQRCLKAAGWERFKRRNPKNEVDSGGKAFDWRYRKVQS